MPSSVPSVAPAQRSNGPVLLADSPGQFRCSLFRNVSLLIWTGQGTLASVQHIQRLTASLVQRFPKGHSNVSFIPDGAPMPTEEARAALAASFDQRLSHIACMTQVLEGEGFWASTMRSAITSMKLGTSQDMAMRVCTSIDEVAAWLPEPHRERTGVVLETEALRTALQVFRDGATIAENPNAD